MPVVALLMPRNRVGEIYTQHHMERLSKLGAFIDACFVENADEVMDHIREAEVILSTWGMPKLNEGFLARVPKLRAVFYAAGSVKCFVTPEMWERDIVVSSAALANAVPVAEYTLAVILLSNKRFWSMMRSTNSMVVAGNFRSTVGIIGASLVGRHLIRLLKATDMNVLLYDPYVNEAEAERLGVKKAELPELMSESDVVTLHAPNLPHLRHMIDADLLARMKDGATFVNTARGRLVDEAALIAELQSGRIYAILDVSDPEPPVAGSPLYTLPNVIYTPHIAGSMNRECHRMVDFAIDELERFLAGTPLLNAVRQEDIVRLA